MPQEKKQFGRIINTAGILLVIVFFFVGDILQCVCDVCVRYLMPIARLIFHLLSLFFSLFFFLFAAAIQIFRLELLT